MKRLCLVVFVFVVCVTHLLGQDVGNATFYHNRFHGRRTSDGSKYHKDSMTCAHKTYPFGTLLKVRNPQNQKEVIVKVTDRGPFSKRLAIDLSYRAADKIGIIRRGMAPVEISIYQPMGLPFKADETPQIHPYPSFVDNKKQFPLPVFKHKDEKRFHFQPKSRKFASRKQIKSKRCYNLN